MSKKNTDNHQLVSASQKKILIILADGQFHSGTEIAEKMACSRSAICKKINDLARLGIVVHAISGKGYQLDRPLQLLSHTAISASLTPSTRNLIAALEIHDSINSTNSYLNDNAERYRDQIGTQKGVVCLAELQTAGRGRRGRDWVSPFGSNIYLSTLWYFQQGPTTLNGLSLAVGVAVIRTLNDYGINDVGLKWPNDIYWRDKKLAGILIEVSGESTGPCRVVIGLGINLYIPKEASQSITQEWVDLSQIMSGQSTLLRNNLTASLLNHLMPMIAHFEKDTLAAYLEEWRDADCMKDKQVNIFMGQHVYSGTVKGIDDSGLLLLENESGQTKAFASGDVSFKP